MLNFRQFNDVTKPGPNHQRIGLKLTDYPELKEQQKSLKIAFNKFTGKVLQGFNEDIGQTVFKEKNVHTNYQNSGYYSSYFWNRLISSRSDFDGIAIWFLLNVEGVHVTIGTTNSIESVLPTETIDRINRNFINKCSQQIEGFEYRIDHKYASFKYIKEDIEEDLFIDLLHFLLPFYEEAIIDYNEQTIGTSVSREEVLRAIVDFEQFGIRDGYREPNKYFFRLSGKETLYPRKYIVLRAREYHGLDNTAYTTDQAKRTLNSIFGEHIEHVDINREIIREKRNLFIEIASRYNMKYQTSEVSYFQIYPNNIPEEGSQGTHYEFIAKNGILYLALHIESRGELVVQERAQLKQNLLDVSIDINMNNDIDGLSNDEIKDLFQKMYEAYQPVIENIYKVDGMNYKDIFKSWWYGNKSVQNDGSRYAQGTKDAYFRELDRLSTGALDGKDIFGVTDIDELQELYERLASGDLIEYNQRHQNTDPSNGLKQYIKFHKNRNNRPIVQTSTSSASLQKGKKMNLNTILYGPPGTGKTYHTINKALQIIDPDFYENNKTNRDALNKKFDEYKSDDQIMFVTFHQSYGYEEFIEGIRADTDTDEISYSLESGIFKNISNKALENYQKYILSNTHDQQINIELLLNDYANYVSEELEKKHTVSITSASETLNETLLGVVNRTHDGSFQSFSTAGSVQNQSLTKAIIFRDFQNYIDGTIKSYQDIKPRYDSQSSYHGNAIYYFELYIALKDYFNQDRTKYTLDINAASLKKYVLIIDEINRGNISKIFGELITSRI